MGSRTYNIQGMDCTDCATRIERGVARLDGVTSARVDFATSKLIVDGSAPLDLIETRVKKLGYTIAGQTPADAEIAVPHSGGISGFWKSLTSRHETRLALAGGAIVLIALIGSLLGLP